MEGKFVDEPCEVEITDGNAIITYPNGSRRIMPLRVLRIAHERVSAALEAHDRRSADIVPFPQRADCG